MLSNNVVRKCGNVNGCKMRHNEDEVGRSGSCITVKCVLKKSSAHDEGSYIINDWKLFPEMLTAA